MRGTWREGSFAGDPQNMLSKALKMGVCFHRGPLLGNMKGRSFPRVFERRDKFLCLGTYFCKEFERYVKKAL
jgi:hypothetical protein